MELGYTILNPKHQKYKIGTVYFEHETDKFYTLRRIGFIVDNQKYVMNMLLIKSHTLTSTWIIQKEGSFKSLNDKEREQVLMLVDDILENFNLQKSLLKILGEIRPQTEIYLKLIDKNLTTKEKHELKKEFRAKNKLIQNYNTAFAKTAKRRMKKLETLNENHKEQTL